MCAAFNRALAALAVFVASASLAQVGERVIDVPTRTGVTQRLILLEPAGAKAVVILYAGGNGGLQISREEAIGWGKGNFLVRTRQLFAEQGLVVAVIDAPSDRQDGRFFDGFRQTPESAADARAVIALREPRGFPSARRHEPEQSSPLSHRASDPTA